MALYFSGTDFTGANVKYNIPMHIIIYRLANLRACPCE